MLRNRDILNYKIYIIYNDYMVIVYNKYHDYDFLYSNYNKNL